MPCVVVDIAHTRQRVAVRKMTEFSVFKKSLKFTKSSERHMLGTELFLKVFVIDCQRVEAYQSPLLENIRGNINPAIFVENESWAPCFKFGI